MKVAESDIERPSDEHTDRESSEQEAVSQEIRRKILKTKRSEIVKSEEGWAEHRTSYAS